MYEYMRGLHQQFFKEPDFPELRQELHELHREMTEGRPKEERRKLLKLVDLEAELRDEISLASFAAGFRLAWGIIAELSTEPPYSFAEEDSMTICGMTMVSTSMTRGCCVSAGPEIYGPL